MNSLFPNKHGLFLIDCIILIRMKQNIPFFKSIPYRNIILDVTEAPYPQENGDDWVIYNRTMNDYDLFICERGSALFIIDDVRYHIKPGMALLIPPGRLINASKTSIEPVKMIAQHFMLYLFRKTDFFSHIQYKKMIVFSNYSLISLISKEIRKIITSKGEPWNPLDTNPLFMVILNAFLEESYEGEDFAEERKSSLVIQIISAIEKDYTDPGLLEKLMKLSSFGYSHTVNIFKSYTGLSLKSFIIERKLEAAKGKLLNGGSVRESAESAGYDDEFYFSRIFKKYTGTTPKEFRKRI